jgi:Glycine zipper
MRRKIIILGLACLTVTGCQTANQTNGAVAGGLIGGAIGTGVGLITRTPVAGAAIGAGTGALVGNAVGAAQDKKEIKAAQAYAAAHMMSLNDVVSLSAQGIPDGQIIRQMDATNSYFSLTTADLVYLNQSHVSPTVITAMQQRSGPRPVVVAPQPGVMVVEPYPPPPVAVGVGVYRRW